MSRWIALVLVLSGCLAAKTLREVQIAVAHEDWEAAHQIVDEAAAKKPTHPTILASQRFVNAAHEGHEAVQSWSLDTAVSRFEQAEAAVPGVPYVQTQRRHAEALEAAWDAMEDDNWPEADRSLTRASRILPRSAQVPVLQAQLDTVRAAERALDNELWSSADDHYATLVDPPTDHFGARQRRVLVHLREAAGHFDREDWPSALEACHAANRIGWSPQGERCVDHASAMARADLSLDQFAWSRALQDLDDAAVARSDTSYVRDRRSLAEPMARAETAMQREDYAGALQQLARATRVAPGLAVVSRRTRYATAMAEGQGAVRDQDWRAARSGYRKALGVERNDRVAVAQIAYIDAMRDAQDQLRRRRWADAVSRLDVALVQRPGDALATRSRAFATAVIEALDHEAASRWKPALASYKRAEELIPGNDFVARRGLAVQDRAVAGALGNAEGHGRAGRFERAFEELGFARDNGAPDDRLAASRAKVIEMMSRRLADHVGRGEFDPGFELVVLGTRLLGPGVTWVEDGRVRLRSQRLDQAWAYVERDQYERGLQWLDRLDHFEPERRGEVGQERRKIRRTWATDTSNRAIDDRAYPSGLDEIGLILGDDPRLQDDLGRLNRELREAWAADVRGLADRELRADHPAAAAAHRARAVEIAGLERDMSELARLKAWLRDQGRLHVSLAVDGEAWRTERLFRRLEDSLLEDPGVLVVAARQRPDVTIAVDATHSCSEATEARTAEVTDDLGAVVETYTIRTVTRTCTATLRLSMRGPDGARTPVELEADESVTDETHDGATGVPADPLVFEADDPKLVRRADRELRGALDRALRAELDVQWERMAGSQLRALSSRSDAALATLVGLCLLRPEVLTSAQMGELERHIHRSFGIEDLSLLLR